MKEFKKFHRIALLESGEVLGADLMRGFLSWQLPEDTSLEVAPPPS